MKVFKSFRRIISLVVVIAALLTINSSCVQAQGILDHFVKESKRQLKGGAKRLEENVKGGANQLNKNIDRAINHARDEFSKARSQVDGNLQRVAKGQISVADFNRELSRFRANADAEAKRLIQTHGQAATRFAQDVKRELQIGLTVQRHVSARVPEPQRSVNFSINGMHFDIRNRSLNFQIMGRVPFRGNGTVKVPNRISISSNVSFFVDFSADVSVPFDLQMRRVVGQPSIHNVHASLRSLQISNELMNLGRHSLQSTVQTQVNKNMPNFVETLNRSLQPITQNYDPVVQELANRALNSQPSGSTIDLRTMGYSVAGVVQQRLQQEMTNWQFNSNDQSRF